VRQCNINTVTDAIRWVFEVIIELECDMEEKFENAQPWAQESGANQDRMHAAAVLGSAHEPTIPASLRDESHVFEWWEKTERSRPDRRDNLVTCLQACVAYLSTLPGEDARCLKKELRETIEILNDVYFPPMFARASRRVA
jgi:hypothetical protein